MTGVIEDPDHLPTGDKSERPLAEFLESRGLDAREPVGVGLNPLVRAAWPVLLLAADARASSEPLELGALRRQVLDGVRMFTEHARAAGIPEEVRQSARYVLCATVDEAVLSTESGARSLWVHQPVLAQASEERDGGEKFFEMLDRFWRNPVRHIHMLELQYLCITLGFAGKYRTLPRGQEQLWQVQRELRQTINKHRWTATPAALAAESVQRTHGFVPHLLSWVIVAAALAVMASVFVVASRRLSDASAPIVVELQKVGLDASSPPAERPPTIKQLLSPAEAGGEVSIQEDNGRTQITLMAADLFASGTATLNPASLDLLRRVATALNAVPGRILVTGYTDDQPVSSPRYRNNFELSDERASTVVGVLARWIAGSRLQAIGAGASAPRYRPESTPENRARNRRVEIVHIRE